MKEGVQDEQIAEWVKASLGKKYDPRYEYRLVTPELAAKRCATGWKDAGVLDRRSGEQLVIITRKRDADS